MHAILLEFQYAPRFLAHSFGAARYPVSAVYNLEVRSSKKETSFFFGLFFKAIGRPLLYTIYGFFAISFEYGRHVLEAHCG